MIPLYFLYNHNCLDMFKLAQYQKQKLGNTIMPLKLWN